MSGAKFILGVCLALSMLKCKNKFEQQETANFFDRPRQTVLTGKWVCNHTIWYSSELVLTQEGKFTYYDQSCLKQNFSEGSWLKQGNFIVLSSLMGYKPQKTQTNCLVSSARDTAKVFFDNEPLQIKGDTLFFVGRNKILEDHKFHRQSAIFTSLVSP